MTSNVTCYQQSVRLQGTDYRFCKGIHSRILRGKECCTFAVLEPDQAEHLQGTG